MFGIFDSKRTRARKQAKEWVQLSRKVVNFRRDVLHPDSLAELLSKQKALEALIKRRDATVSEISSAVETLEASLRPVGGEHYPRNTVTEYIDLIVVGAILAIGVRSFFLQPFKIPTNSMYPTYAGITTEVYFGEEAPSLPERLFRVLQLGAGHRSVKGDPGEELILPILDLKAIRAQRDALNLSGLIENPLITSQTGGYACLAQEPMRNSMFMRFLVLPGPAAFYKFIVGEEEVVLKTNPDFPMRDVLSAIIAEAGDKVRLERNKFGYPLVLRTGIQVPAGGGSVVSFDSKTGDMLFVDRFTYNFRRPEVGEPFVFNTSRVDTMEASERGKYYIKRIGGGPGDTLQVDGPMLLRNGEPADASEAFVRNAEQRGEYEGYLPRPPGSAGGYPLDRPLKIPERSFFALGDNSDASADSRSWGFVPEEAIVGKAVFIYYPFSHRWGLSE